jgi:RNA polymerase sigma-70 factor, ECF subfamily
MCEVHHTSTGPDRPESGTITQVTSGPDDGILVARARTGDTLAFELLVRRYSPPVYRIALGILGDAEAAADTSQDAFIAAWRRLDELRAEQAFAAWLYRITTTHATAAGRARRRHSPLDPAAPAPDPTAGPAQQAIAADLRAALIRALSLLTAEQRACWVLKELEGMSYHQIEEITRASAGAVRGRIHRARIRLAAELTPWR